MIDKFLKAKHWQIFTLLFGLPMVFQIVIMILMVVNSITSGYNDPFYMFRYMNLFYVLFIICIAAFFGWFWSIAIGLQKKIPVDAEMKVNRFKISFFTPLIYSVIFIVIHSFFMNSMINGMDNMESQFGYIWIAAVIIVPLHIFSIICIFYCMLFVAKTIKTVELQRETSFSDFSGEFFMVWFYPIGVWMLQPRINKIVKE